MVRYHQTATQLHMNKSLYGVLQGIFLSFIDTIVILWLYFKVKGLVFYTAILAVTC
jgi:hypothetical protein